MFRHSVLVGEFDSAENPDCNELFCAHCARSYNISYVVKHSNFRSDLYEYNIALIRLTESINFTCKYYLLINLSLNTCEYIERILSR